MIFHVPLASAVAFTASICLYCILGNYSRVRSQGGRQPAATNPPLYIYLCVRGMSRQKKKCHRYKPAVDARYETGVSGSTWVSSNFSFSFMAQRTRQVLQGCQVPRRRPSTVDDDEWHETRAHVISRILMDVVRHCLVTERYFPDSNLHHICEVCGHFSATRYNLHTLGRIVSSHARSCVQDMPARRLGLDL